jgi:mono/diheme cytochrome c family protein
MRFWALTCGTLLTIAFVSSVVPASVRAAGAVPADIIHGKYLVDRVGMCGDCHTPRDEKGQPIADRILRGAALAFKPTVQMPWADSAPNIAGLPGWEEADAIKFLMTGKTNTDLPARPPMPGYRLNKADATAVVHYLLSLSPGRDSSAAK